MFVSLQDALIYLGTVKDDRWGSVWMPIWAKIILAFNYDKDFAGFFTSYINLDQLRSGTPAVDWYRYTYNSRNQPPLTTLFDNSDTSAPHQLKCIYPAKVVWKLTKHSATEADHTTKEALNLDVATGLISFLNKQQPPIVTEFWFPSSAISTTIHDVKFLLSDCYYSHPQNTYWTAGLNSTIPNDATRVADLKLICKTFYSAIGNLTTKVYIEGRKIATFPGFCMLIYFFDQEFIPIPDRDLYKRVKILETLLSSLTNRVNDLPFLDLNLPQAITDIKNLIGTVGILQGRVNTMSDEDIKNRVESIEDKFDTLENLTINLDTSTDIWGLLIGGIVGIGGIIVVVH